MQFPKYIHTYIQIVREINAMKKNKSRLKIRELEKGAILEKQPEKSPLTKQHFNRDLNEWRGKATTSRASG